MKHIKLTQGKVAIVDDADFDWLNQWKWHAVSDNGNWYACRWKHIKMHRLLLQPASGQEVDHKDRNGLNNQRANLRLCTRRENCRNKPKMGKSEYKGVWHDKRNDKWTARISLNNKLFYLGQFSSPIDAAMAYDKKAVELYGDFANPNFNLLKEVKKGESNGKD